MGCRVVKCTPALVESILRRGIASVEPVDVPQDLELVSVRMNFSGHPIIEILVKSDQFDGSGTETFDNAKAWSIVFRRKAPTSA